MILLPFILVVLMGICAIVIDVGMLYVEKFQLQTAVDAAALAGGQELPANPGGAITIANNYAAKNGKVGDEVTPIVTDEVTQTVTNYNYILTVNARRKAPLYFAQIFGIKTSYVTAIASVTVSTVGSVSGAIPVGVEKQTKLTPGDLYTLKEGGGDGSNGNYGLLNFDGKGNGNISEYLANGYSGVLTVGQVISTEPGNKVGQLPGIDERINTDPYATYATVQKGSKRIVIIPIIDSFDINGKKSVIIEGFAVFFLESSYEDESGKGVIEGRFMQMVVGNSTSGSGTNYGAYNLRLTQ